jgi:uncharacterized membrane protein YhiD involved in acid resistance
MEFLKDLLEEIQTIKQQNEQFKQENQRLGQSIEELTQAVRQIEIKPNVTMNIQRATDLIWEKLEPKIGNVSTGLKPQIEQFQTVISKIPNEIKQTQVKEFKIFNGKWFAVWGVFYLSLFLIAIYFTPRIKNVLTPEQLSETEKHLQYHIKNNPKTERKYQNKDF